MHCRNGAEQIGLRMEEVDNKASPAQEKNWTKKVILIYLALVSIGFLGGCCLGYLLGFKSGTNKITPLAPDMSQKMLHFLKNQLLTTMSNETAIKGIQVPPKKRIYARLRAVRDQLPEKHSSVKFDSTHSSSYMTHDLNLNAGGRAVTILHPGRYRVRIESCLYCRDDQLNSRSNRGFMDLFATNPRRQDKKIKMCSKFTLSGGNINIECTLELRKGDSLSVEFSVSQYSPLLTSFEIEFLG